MCTVSSDLPNERPARRGHAVSEVYFVTHPQVVIDPGVPVPDWPLSEIGRVRMEAFATALNGRRIAAIYSSDERKARDGAEILAQRFGLQVRVRAGLEENDRSATGYIAPPEFWEVVEQFFAHPAESVRGWATAQASQVRIVQAMRNTCAENAGAGLVIVVSHGGVGRLLRASLEDVAIGNEARPLHPGGGCYFPIDRRTLALLGPWRSIEDYPGH
jgi:broad specificity phosphatase PhoE